MNSEKKAIKKLEHLLELLEEERKEDINQFNQRILSVSLKDRIQNGSTWFPLELKDSGYGLGEQPFVILEKTKDYSSHNSFHSGKLVNFFTQQSGIKDAHQKGIVHFSKNGQVKVFLYANELPDWINDGKLGLDALFDDRSYKEMKKGVKLAIEAERNKLADFREIFKGDKSPRFEKSPYPFFAKYLNVSQNEAIQQIMDAEDVAIIHGPPGTGKTTTIVEAIRLLTMQKKRILATAPSNAAVDLLTLKLAALGLNVVRIGNISRVDASLVDLTLESQLFNSNEAKEIKRMKKQVEVLYKTAGKFKRSFGPEERQKRKEAYQEARAIRDQIKTIEHYLVNKIIDNAEVVCATLVGANNRYIENQRFDIVVIDEAAQALEPATWIPISKANDKVILAGDPYQLPPTVKSQKAGRAGLEETLIEQCIDNFKNVALLKTQYRMNEKIMGFSNDYFYDNQLEADYSVKNHLLFKNDLPVEFIDTAGCGFEEKQNPKTKSIYNPGEYKILWKHLDTLLPSLDKKNPPNIGIIAPYKQQVIYLKNQINDYFDFSENPIHINTIDSFQGQERDIIYLSLVRSNDKGTIGFLKDYRRMNVAMTRARKKLVVIGDSATLGNDRFYKRFLDYCEEIGAYQSAWSYQ